MPPRRNQPPLSRRPRGVADASRSPGYRATPPSPPSPPPPPPPVPPAAPARFLYRAPLLQFLTDARAPDFAATLAARFHALDGRAPSPDEITSWSVSLPALAAVLDDPRLRAAHILVELRMPIGARRCDVLLTGLAVDAVPTAVVIELKQWQAVGRSALPEQVAIGTSARAHPCAQVRDYVQFLRQYHSAFTTEGVRLTGCAFLHDLTHAPSIAFLRDPVAFGTLALDYPLFTRRESAGLATWLYDHLGAGDGTRAADAVAHGTPRPSEKLLDVVEETIRGTFEWKLLDVQRLAYLKVLTDVETARANGGKAVVIVRGGPGSGKSVLAIQLLAHAARKHWRVVHASGSQAFQTNLQARTQLFARDMMRKVYGARFKKDLPVAEMFCTFSDVARLGDADVLDLVVADEAHRLWEFRQVKWQGYVKQLSTTPMVEELLRATRVAAFFLDDHQAVRAGEIGRSAAIEDAARRMGIAVTTLELDQQFRCNGSESYVRWVDALLGFRGDGDLAWRRYEGYDFRIEEHMPAMVARLDALRATGATCRIVAGYCWPWHDPIGSTLPLDVADPRFEGWSAPWIERTEQGRAPTEHRYFRWATVPECFEQVGSIYSAQGFEFDHVGVIWGEDLVWRKDRWVADPSKNFDATFKRDLKRAGEDPVAKLRSVYRVLLTRGMRGTSVFVLDEETRAHVAAALQARPQAGATAREA